MATNPTGHSSCKICRWNLHQYKKSNFYPYDALLIIPYT
jgi:hypothetical protein